MATKESALRGAERFIEYLDDVLNSSRYFYTPSIQMIEFADQLRCKINILVDSLLQKAELAPKPYRDKKDDEEIMESYRLGFSDGFKAGLEKQTIEVVSDNIKDEVKHKSTSLKKHGVIKVKEAIRQVRISFEGEDDPSMLTDIATLLDDYMSIRFDANNSKSTSHKYDSNQFQTYIQSIILDACKFVVLVNCGASSSIWDDYLTYQYNWLEEVKSSNVRYSLPPDASSLFFALRNRKESKILKGVTSDVIECASLVWQELSRRGLKVLAEDSIFESCEDAKYFNLPLKDSLLNKLPDKDDCICSSYLTLENYLSVER